MIEKYISFDNPLCGISTYKDALNLATGEVTRYVKKLVLTGEENWTLRAEFTSATAYSLYHSDDKAVPYSSASLVCSHFEFLASYASETNHIYQDATNFYVTSTDYLTLSDFTTFLQQQYTNGTPVVVYYALATAETETITVPSGLSGTEEGYLNQSGTPTPTNPIYPTAKSDVWVELGYRKYGTETDTITTLPAEVIADGNNATVGISGNMNQSGVPTPQNPIEPQETGDKTGNLFDKSKLENGWNINTNGTLVIDARRIATTTPIDITGLSSITLTYTPNNIKFIYATFSNGEMVSREAEKVSGTVIDVTGCDSLYICFYRGSETITTNDVSNIMLNTDSTALSYEPYGYKIPISSGGTTTPNYLGEVETTRRIKKLVLDGSEDWAAYSSIADCYRLSLQPNTGITGNGLCSHFEKVETTSQLTNGTFVSGQNYSYFKDTTVENLSGWKTYLQQQYANGTPVTVWYVLATPITGIVNEPIRKIGTYADTISNITVPTLGTSEQFDVNTSLKPSSVELTYHGWHRHEAKKRENGEWVEEQSVSLLSALNNPLTLDLRPDIMDISDETETAEEPEEEME